jgi:hypothetical protein
MGKVAYITRCILMDNLHIPSSGSTAAGVTGFPEHYWKSPGRNEAGGETWGGLGSPYLERCVCACYACVEFGR